MIYVRKNFYNTGRLKYVRKHIYSVKQTETHSVYKFFGIKLSVPIHVQEDTQTLIANLEKKYVLHKTIMRKRF